MNKTFTTMKTNVGNNIQDTSSAMSTIIGTYINDIYSDMLRRINWELIDYDYSFTTSDQDNVLPDNFHKEITAYDNTNKRKLVRTTQADEVDDYLSTIDQTGTVDRYAILELRVRKQPTSASTLSLVSSDAGDTTQTVLVRGISGGVEVTESVTLNGTSAQASSNSYTKIISLGKDGTTTGAVTITSNSGAVTVAIIPPNLLDYRVKVARLYSAPAQSLTINFPYIIRPEALVNDEDFPLIDAADVMELGATMKSLRYKRQYSKAQEYERQYEKGITQLIWDKENLPNRIHMMEATPYGRNEV